MDIIIMILLYFVIVTVVSYLFLRWFLKKEKPKKRIEIPEEHFKYILSIFPSAFVSSLDMEHIQTIYKKYSKIYFFSPQQIIAAEKRFSIMIFGDFVATPEELLQSSEGKV